MGVKVTGALEAASDLMSLAKKSPTAMERAFFKFGNTEMTEAKRLTPVEFGDLRDSGEVSPPEWEGDNLTMELSFGGSASEYAMAVHEDMEAHHDQGEAKFLEKPLNASEPYMDQRVGADFARFLGID
jgi:hypothetical protein